MYLDLYNIAQQNEHLILYVDQMNASALCMIFDKWLVKHCKVWLFGFFMADMQQTKFMYRYRPVKICFQKVWR